MIALIALSLLVLTAYLLYIAVFAVASRRDMRRHRAGLPDSCEGAAQGIARRHVLFVRKSKAYRSA